jgi:hypothetical protein
VPLVGKILSLYPYLLSQIPDEYQVTISELSSPLSYDLLKPQENSVEWNTGILQFFLFEVNTGIVSEGALSWPGFEVHLCNFQCSVDASSDLSPFLSPSDFRRCSTAGCRDSSVSREPAKYQL